MIEMGRSQESVQKGLQELLSSPVGVGLMEFCCISVVKITDICYQGIYLYPLKRIIDTDYTYQYIIMSISDVVTSISKQFYNLSECSSARFIPVLNVTSWCYYKLSYTNLHCGMKFHYN
jgi:hypothetical protein